MNEFEVFNETDEVIDISFVRDLLEYALKHEKLNSVIFNVIFVDNETIHKINRDYRNIDRETDVISFALEDNKEIDLAIGRVLGDIYVSVDRIKSQAKEYGHSEKREMAFLVIHGLLHLLGYDHGNLEEEEIIFRKQELILDGYGIKR